MTDPGLIQHGVNSLLDAAGHLESASIVHVQNEIEAAITAVLLASDRLTDHLGALSQLKSDAQDLRDGIRKAAHEIDELAVSIYTWANPPHQG